MNIGVIFLPVYRATTTAFVLGLILMAVVDAIRISFDIPIISGWIGMIAIWFSVYSLHANRRRHANMSTGIAMMPAILAVLASAISGFVQIMRLGWQHMLDFASSNGVNTDDVEALTAALNDPGFQTAWQENLSANPDVMEVWLPGISWASYAGYWLVVAGFALWFAKMKSAGGAMRDLQQRPAPPEPAPKRVAIVPVDAEPKEVVQPVEEADPEENAGSSDADDENKPTKED